MRCKVGDLAIVVGINQDRETWAIGRIVQCVSLYEFEGYQCWLLKEPLISPLGIEYVGIYDGALRPICDPGDDAKDEMLRPLPNEVTA